MGNENGLAKKVRDCLQKFMHRQRKIKEYYETKVESTDTDEKSTAKRGKAGKSFELRHKFDRQFAQAHTKSYME